MAKEAFQFILPSLSEATALQGIIANINPHAATRPGYQILLDAINSISSAPIGDRLAELRAYFSDAAQEGEPHHQVSDGGTTDLVAVYPLGQEPPAKTTKTTKKRRPKPTTEGTQQEPLAKPKRGRKPKPATGDTQQESPVKPRQELQPLDFTEIEKKDPESDEMTELDIFKDMQLMADKEVQSEINRVEREVQSEEEKKMIQVQTQPVNELRNALTGVLGSIAYMADQQAADIQYRSRDTIEDVLQKLADLVNETQGRGIFVNSEAIREAIQTIKRLVPTFKKENIKELNNALNSLFNLLNQLDLEHQANRSATQQIITAEAIIRHSRGVSFALAQGLENVVEVQSNILEETKKQTGIGQQRLEEAKQQTGISQQRLEEAKQQTGALSRLSRLAQIDLREHNERLIVEWQSYVDDESLDVETREYYRRIIQKALAKTEEEKTREDFDFIDAYDFFSLINQLASPGLSPGWAILFKSLRLILGFLAKRGRWKRAKSRFISAMGRVRNFLSRNKKFTPEQADAFAKSLVSEQSLQQEQEELKGAEQQQQAIQEDNNYLPAVQEDNPYLSVAEKNIKKRTQQKQNPYLRLSAQYRRKFYVSDRVRIVKNLIQESLQSMMASISRAFNYVTQGMSQSYQRLGSRMQNLFRAVNTRVQQMYQQPPVLGERQAEPVEQPGELLRPRGQPVVQPLQAVLEEEQRLDFDVDIGDVELMNNLPYYILSALLSTAGLILLTTIMIQKKYVPKPPSSKQILVKDPPVTNISKDGQVYTFNEEQELPVECSRKVYIDNKGRIRSIVTCMFDRKKETFYDY